MIQRIPQGYIVVDQAGKKIGGPYKTREAAVKRLGQIEYFKKKKAK